MAKSTRAPSRRPTRKEKFPLWKHAPSGQWCKLIKGRRYYFGADQDDALTRYLAAKADIEAGRDPLGRVKQPAKSVDLRTLANHFLTHKKHRIETGELTRRTYADYYATCERLLKHFGKTKLVESLQSDELLSYRSKQAETRGVVSLGNEIQRVRTLLNHAFNEGLIEKPVRVGAAFAKPSRKSYRRAKAEAGGRLFEPSDLRRIIDSADPILRAMVLLGINCGMGNSDIGQLRTSAVDWSKGWLDFPRPKTGIARRVPLWDETLAALKKARDLRPLAKSPEDDSLLFLTKYGQPWHRDAEKSAGPLSAEFRKLLVKLEIHRPGLSFYGLRHTFRTIASKSRDTEACRAIMGHTSNHVEESYIHTIDDERLKAVVACVWAWLRPPVKPVKPVKRKGGKA